jgi:magnesium chelatase family protein
MLARRLTTVLPAMTLTGDPTAVVTTRPFRSPPPVYGRWGADRRGQGPRPGEGSLAQHGVLFLDELPECRRHGLEVLRQPFEDGIA